jgi:hypothetical protein
LIFSIPDGTARTHTPRHKDDILYSTKAYDAKREKVTGTKPKTAAFLSTNKNNWHPRKQNGRTATENKERSETIPQQRREERHASTVEKQDIL